MVGRILGAIVFVWLLGMGSLALHYWYLEGQGINPCSYPMRRIEYTMPVRPIKCWLWQAED